MTPLEQIQRRWPAVHEALAQARPGRTWGLTQTAVPTLRVGEINITSCYDRETEAALQAGRIPDDAEEAWIYGVALGDIQRRLLARTSLQRLHVVVMSSAVARKSLEVVEHPWLEDPRVTMHLGADVGVCEPFTCAPACVWVAERTCQPLRDRLLTALAAPLIHAFEAKQREAIERAIEANRDRLIADPDVGTLRGHHAGSDCYVIAAGPTFDEVSDWLASKAHDGIVVAVNSAVQPLLQKGIVPNYVVAVDPAELLVRHFEGLSQPELLADVPLVYPPGLHPRVLAAWPGTFVKTNLTVPVYRELCPNDPKTCLFVSGTVTHA
ncbi:MAG: 6-hydroxymethylpterin diphosphokinase MptE-like protein, partial [Nannocystaceae bacterium]